MKEMVVLLHNNSYNYENKLIHNAVDILYE